ncbi:MAG: arginine--tRNA ligase [Gammaproteobacteria bacterium]|nr:arginine--tRNA ligase [Gammaproteobacteria bacterium]
MKQYIEKLIKSSFDKLCAAGELSTAYPKVQIDASKDLQHGDFACNIALALAKEAKRKPRDVAEMIVKNLPSSPRILKVEIAGPGFINFFLTPQAFQAIIPEILTAGKNYGRVDIGKGQRILVEFVSSNPTGPLHVGHGRHAAYGAVVSDLLEYIGYSVHREYYVNDAGRQMDILAVSVWLRYLELCGETFPFPANAYKGDYIVAIAKNLKEKYDRNLFKLTKDVFVDLPLDEPAGGDKEIYIDALIARTKKLLGEDFYLQVFDLTLETILTNIREDLAEFGVTFQEWFSERSFTQTDIVDRHIAQMQKDGLVYEQDGALWFRSSNYGDDKDRVLQRANGMRTYFANDLLYHIHKFERGFTSAIDIFGSDHHGYIPRMKAGLQAYGIAPERLTYLLVQFVTLYRGGEQVQMSTRSGSFVTLRELREEVGNDAARYFYVMRKCEQHMDFDLDLAKAKSNENPMYYVQYAYARICSVFRQLAEKQITFTPEEGLAHLELLTQPQELKLLATMAEYKDVIVSAATLHEPHQLTQYLRELANDFHTYYNACQFLVEDAHLRAARLILIMAVRQVLGNGLQLIGVSTPENM